MSRLSRKKTLPLVDQLNDSSEDFAPSLSTNTLKLPPSKPPSSKPPPKEKKKTQRAKKQNALDPNLEMAIALSASLDPDKKDVFLPGAANWKPPPKHRAKTPLELRSSEERTRILADRVSLILDQRFPDNPLASLYPPLNKIKCRSPRLVKALASRTSLWNLSAQKLRANSRFYVPNLLKSTILQVEDSLPQVDASPLSLLSGNLLTLVNEPRGADVSIHVHGDKKIHAHSIIFYCRLPIILKDVIYEGSTQLLSWSEVHLGPALSFLSYVYGATLPECLSTKSELTGLIFLAKKYDVQALESFLKTVDEKGLIDDSDEVMEVEEEEETSSGTQNLIHLIDALERENEDPEENDESISEEKQDLSDIQDFILSQVPPNLPGIQHEGTTDNLQSSKSHQEEEDVIDLTQSDLNLPEKQPEETTDCSKNHQNEENNSMDLFQAPPNLPEEEPEETKEDPQCEDLIDLTQESEEEESILPKPVSPDLFDDLEEDPFLAMGNDVSRKRKSESLEISSKWSKLDDSEDDLFSLPTPSKGEPFSEPSDIILTAGPSSNESPTKKAPDDQEFHTPQSPSSLSLTPVDSFSCRPEEIEDPSGVTPMLDYDSMLTPALRAELKRFGLKAVPRVKACRLLKFIYEETHKERREEAPEDEEPICSSQVSSQEEESFEELAEESIHYHFEKEPFSQESSSEQGLPDKVKRFIRSHPAYWRQVLEYDPIWLEDFVSRFKSWEHGVPKVKEAQILDFFDNECITFRSRKSNVRRGNNKNSSSPKKSNVRRGSNKNSSSPKKAASKNS